MRKKPLISLALASLLLFPCAAQAASDGFQGAQGMGGFQGPVTAVTTDTVAKALTATESTPVILTGTIVERLAGSDDKYMFKDATGQVLVDIDNKQFFGRTVTPQTKVRLFGKVSKKMTKPLKIDVKRFDILQ